MLDGHARARPISAETFASAAQMAVRIATAIEQRLAVMLKVAEQALDAHPTRSTRRCSSGHGPRSLAISGKWRSEREREMRCAW